MMAKEFTINFNNHVLSVGQTLLFQLPEKPLMCITIKSIEGKFFVLNAVINFSIYYMVVVNKNIRKYMITGYLRKYSSISTWSLFIFVK